MIWLKWIFKVIHAHRIPLPLPGQRPDPGGHDAGKPHPRALHPVGPRFRPQTGRRHAGRGTPRLDAHFDEQTRLLNVNGPDGALSASPFTPEGQAALTQYFTRFLGPEARYGEQGEAPKFHFFPGYSFCDNETQVISLISLSSIGALEKAVGAERHNLRFRANIYIESSEPWEEFSWMGRTIAVGATEMVVQARTPRCPATMVNPETAERDANPVKELREHFGHIDLGIFAEVTKGGEIRPGDTIRLL